MSRAAPPRGYGSIAACGRVLGIDSRAIRRGIKRGYVTPPDPVTKLVCFEVVAKEMNAIESRQRGSQWRKLVCPPEHRPVRKRGAKKKTAAKVAKPKKPESPGVESFTEDAILDNELRIRRSRADVLRKEADAQKARLQLDVSMGLLVNRHDVESTISAALLALRARLLELPRGLGPILAGEDDVEEVVKLIDHEVKKALSAASSELRDLTPGGGIAAAA